MNELYYNPRTVGSYGGVDRLTTNSHSSRSNVSEWLSSQDAYTLHKPIRKKFKRRRVIVGGIDHQWQSDLVDMCKFARFNDGMKFILTCIDVFSKFAWVVPIKNKTADSIIHAFETILCLSKRKPVKLQTDQGSEFTNRKFQTWLKKQNIIFFHSFTLETKAQIVERFNRTLKTRMWRYFTHFSTNRYIDNLQDFVFSYNNSFHRSIQRPPMLVNKKNEKIVWDSLYGDDIFPLNPPKYKIGDSVRIVVSRGIFKKGYTDNWSREIFFIEEILKTNPYVYIIKDYDGEKISGTFYEDELQKIVKRNDTYEIERIIRKTRKKGKTKFLIKWRGYPEKFNSWISAEDFDTSSS